MQRQRGELVPVAEVLADLGGPVQAIREAPPRRWWGFAERLDRAGQIGDDFGNRNQLAALTLHGFILTCASEVEHIGVRQKQLIMNRTGA